MVDHETDTSPSATSRPAAAAAATPKRIALAHDWLVNNRGGEAVLAGIAQAALETADPGFLYTLFDGYGEYSNAIDHFERRVSGLNRLPASARRWLLPAYPRGVEQLTRALNRDHAKDPIDLLISTSSGMIKGMRAPEGAAHLCYCHAPARYLWSITDEYTRGLAGRVRGIGFKVFGDRLREWDRRTAANVDTFIANSTHVAREIERCFGRKAMVIHPPVRTDLFTPDESVLREDFWFCFGAHEPYKRTDLAIDAAVRANARLVIAGGGSAIDSLKARAARAPDGLIEFKGRINDTELIGFYRRAACLIYPQIEDFGIVAVEAQACGCPIVARRAGGALDSVIGGETGMFFESDQPDAIIDAVRALPSDPASACRRNARRFSVERFNSEIARTIVGMLNLAKMEVPGTS